MAKKNVFTATPGIEKKYRVSRAGSTQGIYFETDKGDCYAKKEGQKLWANRYGKKEDVYVQNWDNDEGGRGIIY